MVIGPDFIREMRPDEADEVDALLRAAFPGPEEAGLVRALRRDGAMVAEMVLPWADRIGSYAAISRMVAPRGWGALAPVAVRPEWQRGALFDGGTGSGSIEHWRFGTRLVRMIAGFLLAAGHESRFPDTIVVVGAPAFYERCGFSRARAARLNTRYPLSNMMIARPGDDTPEDTLVYPAAFDTL